MDSSKSKQLQEPESDSEIFYELMMYAEWRQDPDLWTNLLKGVCEHLEKPNLRKGWLGFMQKSDWPEKELLSYWSLLLPWLISVSPTGQNLAILQDTFLEIRSSREDFTTVVGRAAVSKDKLPQCRKMVWSPDSILVAVSSSEGVVSVYDLFAIHLFTIPIPALLSEGNKRFVAGFEFVHSPIKLKGWDLSLIVVYSDGMLYSYYVSSEGRYMEGHSVRLSLTGISSATFSDKYNMLFLSTKPPSVPTSYEDNSLSAGISGWRVISEYPFYEIIFPTEEERNMSNATHYLWKITNCMKSMSCIAKMRVSPRSNWLVTFHCCGAIRIWHIPGLRLHRQWICGFQISMPSVEDEYRYKKRMLTPVDTEWRSDEALIVTWDNGTISIHNIDTFEITYGSDPELVHGRLRVSSSVSFKGFLALECEIVFISASGEENVVEDDDGYDKSVLDATSEFIQDVMYFVTDSVKYMTVRKPNQLTRRIYRLLGIKSITPEERYFFYLEDGEFEKALDLAKKFRLNEDKVYQKQWAVNAVSSFSISEFLVNVNDEAWILQEFVSRVAESLDGVHELHKFGLKYTDFNKIFDVNKNDIEKICVESLTEMQKLKLKTRLMLLRFSSKLEIYEMILKEQNQTSGYNMDLFKKLRNKHMVEIAIMYAREGNPVAVDTIIKKYPSLVSPYILVVLNNFPETLNPSQYSYLLPQCNSEGVPAEWPLEKIRKKDWVENDKFKFLLEEETVPKKYNRPRNLTDTILTKWYIVRAMEIEKLSGIVQNAVKLLHYGRQFNIKGLDRLQSDLLTAEVLILELQREIDFQELIEFSPLDKALKLLENSTEETFLTDVQKYLLPYLLRCNFKNNEERYGLFLDLMVDISSTKLNLSLKLFKHALNGYLSIIGNAENLIQMIHDCIYSYKKLDRLNDSLEIVQEAITWLSALSDTPANRSLLEYMYIIREELIATEILQKYDFTKPVIELHNVRNNEKEVTDIIKEMTKKILKAPYMKKVDFEKLLKDILFLQEICFTTFPVSRCYELFATAILGAESLELIEFSTNFICCRKEDEVTKAVDYESSIRLVLDVARNYFNSSRSHADETMLLAKGCLHLIKGEEEEITKELDLILAVRLLSQFGVNLLPVQIRNCEDKMKLIECVLDKNRNAYKNVQKLYKLACKLWVCNGDSAKRYSVINVRLAEESFEKENFSLCSELCGNIMNHVCIEGWEICLKLGTCEKFKETEFKLKLIEFAYAHCPTTSCYAINELRKCLERAVIFDMLKNYYQNVKTEVEEEQFSDVRAKLYFVQKLLKRCQNEKDPTDESFDSKRMGEENVSVKKLQHQVLKIAEFIMMLHFSAISNEISSRYSVLDSVFLECAKLLIFDDTATGLSFLLCLENRMKCDEFLLNLPTNPLTFQLAMYFSALSQCASESKNFINLTPLEVLQCALVKGDDNFNYRSVMMHKYRNDEYWQAQIASDLNCGIDSQRFISDVVYRRDTIFGLAMTLDLEKVLVAIRLAEQNNISSNEMAILHIESFLKEYSTQTLCKLQSSLDHPTILKLIKEDVNFLKNRLALIFDSLNGCDYTKLTVYFTVLNSVESGSNIYSLTPKQHLKLMKKVKATSPEINYIQLITHKADLLTILQPALTNDNFSNVIRLVKNLPDCIRADFNINILFRKKAVGEFFLTIKEVTSLKQCLKQIRHIFNKWLNKVDVSDIKIFMEETVWHRNIAITIDYEFRKHIILALVSWISCRDDYSENVRFLTSSIQERLDIMDRVWDETDEDILVSSSLRNYLYEIEIARNNNAKTMEIVKKGIIDEQLNNDEFLILYNASKFIQSTNEFLNSVQYEDEAEVKLLLKRKRAFSAQLLSTSAVDDKVTRNTNTTSEDNQATNGGPCFSSHLKHWPEELTKQLERLSQTECFEKLLTESTTTEQVMAVNWILDEFRLKDECPDIRPLQISLLYKLITIKDNDRFTMVAKLMDETSMSKKEIMELVTNNLVNGDILTLVWICIQSNKRELEDMVTDLLNKISLDEVKSIASRIKTLPWDVVRALTCSSVYRKIFEIVTTVEDNGVIADDVIKVLNDIQLGPEACTLDMNVNNISDALKSFHTALLLSNSS